jgi:N-acetylmuramoyl-L-alanine amidase
MLTLLLFQISVTYGWDYVCIDPGHGGPGAQKFKNNGDGYGTLGYRDSLSEQWINLQVAYA